MNKPVADACDRNSEPIFNVIEPLFRNCKSVLEIGSGTGQHAVYFAARMPALTWHTSDLAVSHEGIMAWIRDSGLDNIRQPVELDVKQGNWPELDIDGIFSANTVHIMHMDEVERFIQGAGKLLPVRGKLVLYGPFNYQNRYTSESNARFDEWLKARDPGSGIRNFEDINNLASGAGMQFCRDYEMPANNRILYWEKIIGRHRSKECTT